MRIIDADRLKETIRGNDYNVVACHNSMERGMFTTGIMQAIDEAPTIDARPVIHGRWETTDNEWPEDWHCSHCGAIVEADEQDRHNWYFCYHCGADMREADQ